ncbi:hypothetical protein [Halolamina salifodinae]|uniref:Uncharacterized protein n=1 Tax=Halolamina salifodinae TaxID=1202767 RepID=A0A8T4H3D8_9EURY|nr:hypothetical protein [Halolamina salifodinae]MBP1988145.1 hypothetical protein [Halolamina salifodinae]
MTALSSSLGGIERRSVGEFRRAVAELSPTTVVTPTDPAGPPSGSSASAPPISRRRFLIASYPSLAGGFIHLNYQYLSSMRS